MMRLWSRLAATVLALLSALSSTHGLEYRGAVALKPEQRRVWEELVERLSGSNSFALVIGISDYDDFPDLPGVREETERVSKALADQGFQVEPLDEGGRVTILRLREKISRFVQAYGTKPENRLIIYVASHGYKDPKPGGYGYLLASDTRKTNAAGFEDSAYSVLRLSQDLGRFSAKHVFLFFNACFSGAMVPALTRGESLRAARPPDVKALSPEAAAWTRDLLSHDARLALTAGSDDQLVPDQDNPYALAIADGLEGEADLDHDGLILGSELAAYVRGRVGRETRETGRPNDAVFAILSRAGAAAEGSPPAASSLRGDFVFLSRRGPSGIALEGRNELAEILAARAKHLPSGQFVECADCPVMVGTPKAKFALARNEVTYAEWDACHREFGCSRYLPDDGLGRGDRPAGGMTWQDALEFISWVDAKKGRQCARYRLPTRAEWLDMAKAGARGLPGDVGEAGMAVCSGCGPNGDRGRALPVGSLGADDLGLNDMVGNLWEWVDDPAAEAGDADPCDSPELKERFAALSEDELCQSKGTVMGGSFATAAGLVSPSLEGKLDRTSNRRSWSWPTVGLRVACDLR